MANRLSFLLLDAFGVKSKYMYWQFLAQGFILSEKVPYLKIIRLPGMVVIACCRNRTFHLSAPE